MRLTRYTAVVVSVIALAFGAVVPASAGDQATGSITATLTSWSSGASASAGCVGAYVAPDYLTAVATVCTGSDGVYVLDDLTPGDYRLRFSGFTGVAPIQWYAPAALWQDPGAVTVLAGADSDVDYALLPSGSILGRVIDGAGDPVAGVTVTGDEWSAYGVSVDTATATTGADGRYVLTGLTADYYVRMQFDPPMPYARESFPDAAYLSGDSFIYRADEVQGGIDAQLEIGGAIEGTIAAPPALITDGNGCVFLYPKEERARPQDKACGALGSDFRFERLKPGKYALCVNDDLHAAGCGTTDSAWFGASYSTYNPNAKFVNVTAGSTTTRGLAFGGTVKVNVVMENGKPFAGGCLTMVKPIPVAPATVCSPADGIYSFTTTQDYTGSAEVAVAGATNAVNRTYYLDSGLLTAGDTTDTQLHVESAGTSSVRLSLDRSDGKSMPGECVYASLATPSGQVSKGTDCNLEAGHIAEFTSLPAGEYTFDVKTVVNSFYKLRYPNGINDTLGEAVSVGEGQSLNLSWTIPLTQTMAGIVTGPDEQPVADAKVSLTNSVTVFATTTTAADGSYSITGPVEYGELLVTGGEGLGQQWYGQSATHEDAHAVIGPWSWGSRYDVNLSLPAEARAQGTIRIPSNVAWDSACVVIVDPDAATVYGKDCGAPGSPFDIGNVAPGTYRVCVVEAGTESLCASTGTPENFLDGGWTTVTLATGDNTVPLIFGGTLRVKPFVAFDLPDAGCAQIVDRSEPAHVLAESCDLIDGTIDVPIGFDLHEGDARVRVFGFHGYQERVENLQSLTGGRVVEQMVSISQWQELRGTITRPAGFETAEVCVLATDLVEVFERTCLDASKSAYRLPLPPGKYFVEFTAKQAELATQWYKNSPSVATATQVTIAGWQGAYASAVLVPSGTIQGVIRTWDGLPATEGCAVAVTSEGAPAQRACVDGAGHYSLDRLAAGSYRVKFVDVPGHALRWYDGAVTREAAKAVLVVAGAVTTVDQSLVRGASATGTVTLGGSPATGGCAELYSLSGVFVTDGCVDVAGTFAIEDVPTGTYKVLFTGFDGAADRWHGGAGRFETAAAITFSAGESVVIDASLAQGGSISGASSDVDGLAGHSIVVALYDADGNVVTTAEPEFTTSGTDFTYRFDNVAAGHYTVAVIRDGTSTYRYYASSASLSPGVVDLPSNASWDITGINVGKFGNTPVQEGALWGRLNVPASWTSPTVCAVAVTSTGVAKAADCGARGSAFEIVGLAPGSAFKIMFTNGVVRTGPQFSVFSGAKLYLGNTTSRTYAPSYAVTKDASSYLPVWFYSDVTYKTTNFAAVQWMGDQGFYRSSANTFRPESTLTRRDLALYLYRAAGSPAVTLPSKSPFTDVSKTDAAYKPLLWMRSHKIWTTTTYKPSAAVDKKTEALILYRAAGSPAVTLPSKNLYRDIRSSDSAYKAVTWANKYKIVPKASTSTYGATSLVKRKSGAATLYEWWRRFG